MSGVSVHINLSHFELIDTLVLGQLLTMLFSLYYYFDFIGPVNGFTSLDLNVTGLDSQILTSNHNIKCTLASRNQ